MKTLKLLIVTVLTFSLSSCSEDDGPQFQPIESETVNNLYAPRTEDRVNRLPDRLQNLILQREQPPHMRLPGILPLEEQPLSLMAVNPLEPLTNLNEPETLLPTLKPEPCPV